MYNFVDLREKRDKITLLINSHLVSCGVPHPCVPAGQTGLGKHGAREQPTRRVFARVVSHWAAPVCSLPSSPLLPQTGLGFITFALNKEELIYDHVQAIKAGHFAEHSSPKHLFFDVPLPRQQLLWVGSSICCLKTCVLRCELKLFRCIFLAHERHRIT